MVKRRSGSVINIGSSWSSKGSIFNQDGGGPDYCVSKAAIQALTKSAAQDVATAGVRVNAIAPGAVLDTPMHDHDREQLGAYAQFVPMGRLQYSNDIVGTAVYLASDASGYVTGQSIHVNGGMLMVD
jgi:3-oxoacyl-[acyl-carrier protein] reductase